MGYIRDKIKEERKIKNDCICCSNNLWPFLNINIYLLAVAGVYDRIGQHSHTGRMCWFGPKILNDSGNRLNFTVERAFNFRSMFSNVKQNYYYHNNKYNNKYNDDDIQTLIRSSTEMLESA